MTPVNLDLAIRGLLVVGLLVSTASGLWAVVGNRTAQPMDPRRQRAIDRMMALGVTLLVVGAVFGLLSGSRFNVGTAALSVIALNGWSRERTQRRAATRAG